MPGQTRRPAYLACKRESNEVPLIAFMYQRGDHIIWPQHLPILIHDPTKLAGVLPAAEGRSPAGDDD